MIIRKQCRICKNKLKKIISFNKISLVGEFLKNKKKNKKYPLSLNYCISCMHVQIAEIIDPKKLFSNYLWETGVTISNHKIFKQVIKSYQKKINHKTKVFEIASNDGSFLKFLNQKFKCHSVGIDPALNLKKKEKKINQILGFFNYKESKKIFKKFGSFDLIFARNVLAHVTDPNEIFLGINHLLAKEGKAIIEVPHLLPIIKNLQYDNIFHEHQGFHSIKSIKDLCERNHLKLTNVELIKSQGGSIRCELKKRFMHHKERKKVSYLIAYEKKNKLFSANYLNLYKNKINFHKKKLYRLLKNIKSKKKKISIYGASGKGQALLQFCNINYKLIDKVYDISKLKNNRYTPGTNLIINHPKYINRTNIDYLFLSAWNIKEEIMKQEKKFYSKGGKFIIPFPTPKIIQ